MLVQIQVLCYYIFSEAEVVKNVNDWAVGISLAFSGVICLL